MLDGKRLSGLPGGRLCLLAALAAAGISSGCERAGEEEVRTGEPESFEPSTPTGAGAAEPPQPEEGELLLAAPPRGWVETGAVRTPVLRMAEYGPPDEAEGTIERLTLEAQSGEPLPDPIEFVLGVSRDLEMRCDGFENINISSGYENGYPTSVRLMICPQFKDSPHGQVVMAKAIRGAEQFYVITRRRQGPSLVGQGDPLTAQSMAEWTTHLKAVQLCDTRGEEHPCPVSPDA